MSLPPALALLAPLFAVAATHAQNDGGAPGPLDGAEPVRAAGAPQP